MSAANDQQILQLLNSIVTRLNEIANNSKTTEEMDLMNPINRNANLRVSISGVSKRISIQNLLDEVGIDYVLGNIPAKFKQLVIDFDAAGSLHSKMLSAINNIPGEFILQQGTLYFFTTSRVVLSNGNGIAVDTDPDSAQYAVITEFYVLTQQVNPDSGGVASIGLGGNTVIANNGIRYFMTHDTRSYEPTEFDLGDIGTDDVWTAVNGDGPFSTPNEATILFKATQDGTDKLWLYVGAEEEVGTGEATTDSDDFRLFPDEDNVDPPPPFQETLPIDQWKGVGTFRLDNHEARLYYFGTPKNNTSYKFTGHTLYAKTIAHINAASQPTMTSTFNGVATTLENGIEYMIQSIGTTDFTLIGAASNTVGLSFTATGAGTGTGTASENGVQIGGDPFEPNNDMYLFTIFTGKRTEYRFISHSQGGAGTGDMLKTTYDPNTVGGDAFDMDNMVEGTLTKILTAVERANIGTNKAHADSTHAPSNAEANPAVVSQLEAETGTATTERIWTAQRVAQAIAALASGGGLDDVIDDLTPQLGGTLDLNSKPIMQTFGTVGTIAANKLCSLKKSGSAGMLVTDNASEESIQGLIGIKVSTGSGSGTYYVYGKVPISGFAQGDVLYAGLAGAIVTSPYSNSGYCNKIIGHGIDSSNIFLNPSADYFKNK